MVSEEVRADTHTNNYDVSIRSNTPSNYDWMPLTFLNLVIQSGFIPNTKLLSAMLVTKAGLGKTSKLEVLKKFEFVKYTMDITPKRLGDFLQDVEDGKYKFLVIPDYIATLGHAQRTIELARSTFRAMIEEGVSSIDVYGMEKHFKQNPKAGLISGITPEFFNENTRIWKSDGFLSRFLLFSYSHTAITSNQILDNIRDRINTIGEFNFAVDRNPKEPVIPKELDNNLRIITYQLAGTTEPPYRAYQQVYALVKSSAVLRKSDMVEIRDIDLITSMLTYMNRSMNPI